MIEVVYDDGGRADAGYKGEAGDCACRAVAIVLERPYADVYAELNEAAKRERPSMRRKRSSAREGVHTRTMRRYLEELGWTWVPTMEIGSGCRVHLRADELPGGRIIARVSKHYTAVIDGVIHDTHDPSRDGTRCVYGYFMNITPEALDRLTSDHFTIYSSEDEMREALGR